MDSFLRFSWVSVVVTYTERTERSLSTGFNLECLHHVVVLIKDCANILLVVGQVHQN